MSSIATLPAGDRYVLVSADCHAGGSMDQYRGYLDPAYRDEFDAWREQYKNPFRDLQGGGRTRNWDHDRRISELEADGIVGEVLFPNTVPPFFPAAQLVARPPSARDFERRLAGIRAHNRWLADWCSLAPERRAGVAQIFLNDVDEAVQDVRFAKDAGLRGGVLMPGRPDDSELAPLVDPVYEPLWSVCEELEVTINHHSGSAGPKYGKYPVADVLWLVETSWFSHRALWHLILGGVFERHPNLKFVVTEQGASWVPSTLAMLDGYHAQMASGRVGVVEQGTQVLPGERGRALVVGVIAAPHELVDADEVAALGLARAREAGGDPAVAGEVLARLQRQALVVGVADLSHASRRHLRVVAVEHGKRARHP